MATSGTTDFDLSIDRLIERAYARCNTKMFLLIKRVLTQENYLPQ